MSSACKTVLAPAESSEENTGEDDAGADIDEDDREGEDNDDEVGCAGMLRRTPFLASRDESLKDVGNGVDGSSLGRSTRHGEVVSTSVTVRRTTVTV
jgi:hypothetical protein